MSRNIRLLLEYDGTRYLGWQRLGGDANTGTIQGKLETALRRITGEDALQVIGSGRTDAGVHALGQTANFHTGSCQEILDALHRYLPEDIGVLDVSEAGGRFHSRLNALSKTYLYRIGKETVPHTFDRKYVWTVPGTLDIERMRQAARLYEGVHDFRGFSSMKQKKKSSVREIFSTTVEETAREIHITYRGNGFLHNMVRILTGTLAEIGLHQREPEQILKVYESLCRQDAGITAPPQGLFLVCAEYPSEHRISQSEASSSPSLPLSIRPQENRSICSSSSEYPFISR